MITQPEVSRREFEKLQKQVAKQQTIIPILGPIVIIATLSHLFYNFVWPPSLKAKSFTVSDQILSRPSFFFMNNYDSFGHGAIQNHDGVDVLDVRVDETGAKITVRNNAGRVIWSSSLNGETLTNKCGQKEPLTKRCSELKNR